MFRPIFFLTAFAIPACIPAADPDSANHAEASAALSASSSANVPDKPMTNTSAAPSALPTNQAMENSPDKPAASVAADKPRPLDNVAATKAAQAKGMKASLIVSNPVTCPAMTKPKGDVKLLQAKGVLAGTIVDMEGFLRADMGIPEAVALLGEPVLCNGGAVSGYLDMHLAPRDPSVHAATIETHDDEMIGLIVEFENTVAVDVVALEKRYGKPRHTPGPFDSFEAGSEVFDVDGPDYRAYFSFARRKHADPTNARQVHQILFRRTAMIEILPEGFHSTADVARLVALALRPSAPDAVGFAGTLGLYNPPVNHRISFSSALPIRNISDAAVVLRDEPERDRIKSLEVRFKSPIAGDAKAFAGAFAKAMGVSAPAVSDEGKRTLLNFNAGSEKRGKVLLDFGSGGLRAMQVIRADSGS